MDEISGTDEITSSTIGQVSRSDMVPGGRGGLIHPPADSARARELARRRWDGVSRAARLGIVDAGGQLPVVDARKPANVVRYLVEQHTLNAADPSARGAAQSFKQVMDLAYPKPEREVTSTSAGVPAGGLSIALSPELARELLAELRARRDARATASDSDVMSGAE